MAGGTWKILVEEGKAADPTQSTLGGSKPSTSSKISKKADKNALSDKQIASRTATVAAFSVGIATGGFNQYYSITGQTAKKNRMNASLTYGGIAASAAVQLASGNIFGAGLTVAAGTAMLGNQVINFQKEITEQNASSEYLRSRSNTSVNNGNDFFNFSLR